MVVLIVKLLLFSQESILQISISSKIDHTNNHTNTNTRSMSCKPKLI